LVPTSVEYSLIGTSYNTVETIKPCLESIIHMLDTKNMELIICDNESKDGTREAIEQFAPFFMNLKVISKKSTRGKGRQIAFLNSSGKYLIQFDLDALYNEGLRKLFVWHERNKPEYAVIAGNSIFPRNVLEAVGGWNDLNWSEDLDLWIRLTLAGSAKWYGYETNRNIHLVTKKDKTSKIPHRLKRRIRILEDLFALHRITLRGLIRKKGFSKKIPIYLLAKILSLSERNIIDISKYSRESVIDKNSIDLGLEGENFVWYKYGFNLD
jgi:glycosyltransferase involved in cell wall biosynthesis